MQIKQDLFTFILFHFQTQNPIYGIVHPYSLPIPVFSNRELRGKAKQEGSQGVPPSCTGRDALATFLLRLAMNTIKE